MTLLTSAERRKARPLLCALPCALLMSLVPSGQAHADDDDDRHHGDDDFRIEVLSSRPYMVSGGDALVRVTAKKRNVRLRNVRIELNGADVTDAFVRDAVTNSLTGLVTGLRVGKNRLDVDARRNGRGRADADLTLTNYPIQGPIISGPHEFPFACTTKKFVPFPGSPALGPPLDSDCSITRRVQYVYRTTDNTFASLPQPHSNLPANLAFTTTVTGARVPYIVRLETGTINRAIYQTAILHNPNDPTPSPFAPPAGWNKRLIYPLGGGCIGGWYTQGPEIVDPVNHSYLSQGYGVASATLNTFGNNCNDLLSSETILMVKERFIESYGVPRFTIGTGGSGGAYQSNQTGDNYPGTFDGIVTTSSFPDVTTGMVPMHSSRLLEIYFNDTSRPVHEGSADGDLGIPVDSRPDPGNEQGAREPDGSGIEFPPQILPGVGPQFRYDPDQSVRRAGRRVRPHRERVRPHPEYAVPRRCAFRAAPLDNVGVQYGLRALNGAPSTSISSST